MVLISLLATHPFKIIFYTFENLFGFAFAIFALKPFFGACILLAAITGVAQTNHIIGDSARRNGIIERKPMVSSRNNFTKQPAKLISAYSAAIMMIFEAGLPLFRRECIRKIAFTGFTTMPTRPYLFGICFVPFACLLNDLLSIVFVIPTTTCNPFFAVFVIIVTRFFSEYFTIGIPILPHMKSALFEFPLVIGNIPFVPCNSHAPSTTGFQSTFLAVISIKKFSRCRESLTALCTGLHRYGIIGHCSNSLAVGEPMGVHTAAIGFIFTSILAQMFYGGDPKCQ